MPKHRIWVATPQSEATNTASPARAAANSPSRASDGSQDGEALRQRVRDVIEHFVATRAPEADQAHGLRLARLPALPGARREVQVEPPRGVAVDVEAWRIVCVNGQLTLRSGRTSTPRRTATYSAGCTSISASLRKVHHAGALRRRGVDLARACEEAGIQSFLVDAIRRQHAHLGPDRVERLPERLLRADLDLKGASMLDARVVLELLVLELAEPRKD